MADLAQLQPDEVAGDHLRTMNTPTVTMVAENTGSPTMGRRAMRSTAAPIMAVTRTATARAGQKPSPTTRAKYEVQ